MAAAAESLRIHKTEQYYARIREILAARAKLTAELHPKISDYVVLPWLNRQIDKEFEKMAAELVAHEFRMSRKKEGYTSKKDRVTHILGIENSGISFAKALSELFPGVELLIAQKLNPDADLDKIEYDNLIRANSFSKKEQVLFNVPVNILKPSDVILIADDFLAMGGATVPIITRLQDRHLHVAGVGVYANKLFLPGTKMLETQYLVPVFSAIEITKIFEYGQEEKISTLSPGKDRNQFYPI